MNIEEIRNQLKELGWNHLPEKKASKLAEKISNNLWEGEKISGIVQGVTGNNENVLVLTQTRLISIAEKIGLMSGRVEEESFPYDKITSIQYKNGVFASSVMINTAGGNREIKNCNQEDAKSFVDKVQYIMNQKNQPTQVNQTEDKYAQLERLGSLLEKKLITQEEFDKEKTKILG